VRLRIGLIAATAAAAAVPLFTATTASASGEFHVSGVYQTQAECTAAGQAGQNLWGPVWFCSYGAGYYFLYTH
jgi:hypothetical protein